jgi:transcriptional regulator with XRE-family HTH domain
MTVEAIYGERLGARVRELRRERRLTLDDLAERSGVSRAMISKVERGEKNPTLVVAAKVAEGFGVTLSELLGVEERREVVVVPRARRMVMRDPETGFERQLLSPTFGGRGVEFVRNVVRGVPTAPPGGGRVRGDREGAFEGRRRRRGASPRRGRLPVLRGRRFAPVRQRWRRRVQLLSGHSLEGDLSTHVVLISLHNAKVLHACS